MRTDDQFTEKIDLLIFQGYSVDYAHSLVSGGFDSLKDAGVLNAGILRRYGIADRPKISSGSAMPASIISTIG